MKLTVTRRLACPACGDLLGDAVYRRWPGSLTIRTTPAITRAMTAAHDSWAVIE